MTRPDAGLTATRLAGLEQKLIGQRLSADIADSVSVDDLAPLSPISDVRGSAEYRRDAALTLLRRALENVAHE